jgi:hypothetical protein
VREGAAQSKVLHKLRAEAKISDARLPFPRELVHHIAVGGAYRSRVSLKTSHIPRNKITGGVIIMAGAPHRLTALSVAKV